MLTIMALKDLKQLAEKENLIYLILIIWVLAGFTISQFLPWIVSVIIFLPLMYICVVLILITLISKRPINDVDKKRFITGTILGILLIIPIILIAIVAFIVAIFSYIIITSIFTMRSFLDLGISLDEKIDKLPPALKRIDKFGLYAGGTAVSGLLIIGVAVAGGVGLLVVWLLTKRYLAPTPR